jgi:hypothetical protein
MTSGDFLSGLLDRAQGRAPVVERRRPALFEPPRPASGDSLVEASLEAAPAYSEPHATAYARDLTAPPPAPRPPVPTGTTLSAPPVQPAPLVEPVPARQPAIPAHPAPPAHQPRPQESLITRTIHETTVAREPAQPAVQVRIAQPPPAPVPPVAPVRATATAPVPGQPSPRPDSPAPAPAIQPRPPAPRVATQNPARPPAPSQIARASIQRPGSPEPTIHVTIGRIEVRAMPPAVPASRSPRPNGPKLTLDSYLRARNGGRP